MFSAQQKEQIFQEAILLSVRRGLGLAQFPDFIQLFDNLDSRFANSGESPVIPRPYSCELFLTNIRHSTSVLSMFPGALFSFFDGSTHGKTQFVPIRTLVSLPDISSFETWLTTSMVLPILALSEDIDIPVYKGKFKIFSIISLSFAQY